MQNKRPRGQAMMLGVIGLLLLAIGMYSSYNLSRSVYEKIQLQNAADAAAYSTATLEARAFNFIAFSNRAQAANYVQMMESEVFLAQMLWMEALVGIMGDWLQCQGQWLIDFGIFPAIIAAGRALKAAGEVIEGVYKATKTIVDALVKWTPKWIQYNTAENQALGAVAVLLIGSTTIQIEAGNPDIIEANDPDAKLTNISYAMNTFNSLSFLSALDWKKSGSLIGNSINKEKADDAKRLMAEIVNATRVGTPPNGPEYLINRTPLSLIHDYLDQILNSPDGGDKNKLEKFVRKILKNYTGTAKMLSCGNPDYNDRECNSFASEDNPLPQYTGMSQNEYSAMSRGEALVVKDGLFRQNALVDWLWSDKWKKFTSVVMTRAGGKIWRYEQPSGYGSLGAFKRIVISADGFNTVESGLKWESFLGKGGIQPYLIFKAKEQGISAERISFNQPDVWVYLNKLPENMALPGQSDLKFEIKNKNQQANVDMNIAESGLLFGPGFHVLARAQVYYHRPGAWQEPPNLFNPFWGARLAPKNAAIKRLLAIPGIGGQFSQIIADNIWMH